MNKKVILISINDFTFFRLVEKLEQFTISHGVLPSLIYMTKEGIEKYKSLMLVPPKGELSFRGIPIKEFK